MYKYIFKVENKFIRTKSNFIRGDILKLNSDKLVLKVLINQGYILLGLSILILIIFPNEIISFLLGGIIAAINFNINAVRSKKLLTEKSINKLNHLLFYTIRLVLGVLGALISAKITSMGIITYFIGYLTNFISIVLYGIRLK